MPKIAFEVDLQRIEQIISQLKIRDQITLLRRLEQKAWGERFRALVAKVDKRRKRYPVSRRELLKWIKQARQERDAASRS